MGVLPQLVHELEHEHTALKLGWSVVGAEPGVPGPSPADGLGALVPCLDTYIRSRRSCTLYKLSPAVPCICPLIGQKGECAAPPGRRKTQAHEEYTVTGLGPRKVPSKRIGNFPTGKTSKMDSKISPRGERRTKGVGETLRRGKKK